MHLVHQGIKLMYFPMGKYISESVVYRDAYKQVWLLLQLN